MIAFFFCAACSYVCWGPDLTMIPIPLLNPLSLVMTSVQLSFFTFDLFTVYIAALLSWPPFTCVHKDFKLSEMFANVDLLLMTYLLTCFMFILIFCSCVSMLVCILTTCIWRLSSAAFMKYLFAFRQRPKSGSRGSYVMSMNASIMYHFPMHLENLIFVLPYVRGSIALNR